jgi:hypothetical protein
MFRETALVAAGIPVAARTKIRGDWGGSGKGPAFFCNRMHVDKCRSGEMAALSALSTSTR